MHACTERRALVNERARQTRVIKASCEEGHSSQGWESRHREPITYRLDWEVIGQKVTVDTDGLNGVEERSEPKSLQSGRDPLNGKRAEGKPRCEPHVLRFAAARRDNTRFGMILVETRHLLIHDGGESDESWVMSQTSLTLQSTDDRAYRSQVR